MLKKLLQTKFEIERAIKKKYDNFYVKVKGFDNSFKSWIDEKDILI